MKPEIPNKKDLYLAEHPFDYNIFIMMKYSQDDYHTWVERHVRRAFEKVGFFNPVFAKDLTPFYFPTLADAIRESIGMCRYGIAIFTPQEGGQFNPNVAFELGIMWEQQKDILVLKDRRVPTLFTNIAGLIYEEFDGEDGKLQRDANELYLNLTEWLRQMKRIQEMSLKFVFVKGLEHIIESPRGRSPTSRSRYGIALRPSRRRPASTSHSWTTRAKPSSSCTAATSSRPSSVS
jgi:hypothetical protein